MKKIKKQLLIVLSVLCCVVLAIGLTACGKTEAPKDGKSAIDLWLELPENSGKTSEDFWKELKGEKGDKGDKGDNGAQGEPGKDGKDGVDGKSAYEVWKGLEGNADKTEAEFIEALKGIAGKDGVDGKDGVGIESVTVEDGKFIIKLTDGSTKELNIPAVSNTCEHTNVDKFVLQQHAKVGDEVLERVTLVVCLDCRGSELVRDPNHTWIEAEEGKEFEVKATCLTDGFKAKKKCELCGEYGDIVEGSEVEALGHDPVEVTIIGKDEHICDAEKGYWTIDKCTRCGEYIGDRVHHDKVAHDFGDEETTRVWTVKVAPRFATANDDGIGTRAAVCTICGKEIPVSDMPALNIDDYEFESDPFECAGERTIKVTYKNVTVKEEEKDVAYLTFNVKVAAKDHTITVASGDTYKANEVMTITDADIKSDDNEAGKIDLFVNIGKTCDEAGASATAKCDDCGKMLYIKVRYEHAPVDTAEAKAAFNKVSYESCEAFGVTDYFTCIYCNKSVRLTNIKPLGHQWTYRAEKEDVKAGEKQLYSIYKECTRTAANDKIKEDCTAGHDEPIYKHATFDEVEVVAAKCNVEGYRLLNFYDKEGKLLNVDGPIKEILPAMGHYYQKDAESAKIFIDSVVDYEDFIAAYGEGILELFANEDQSIDKLTCAHSVAAAYTCGDCGKNVQVTLTKKHQPAKDSEDKEIVTIHAPTCTEDGYTEFDCGVCGAKEQKKDIVKATGHNYSYKDGKIVCSKCDAINYDYVNKEVTDPTCKKGAVITYICKDAEGKEIKVPVTVSDPVHKLEDELASEYELNKDYEFTYVRAKGEDGQPLYDAEGNAVMTKKYHIYSLKEGVVFSFVNVPAPCNSEDGTQGYYICSDCGKMILIKVKAEHTPKRRIEDHPNTVEPTCEATGTYYYECAVCKDASGNATVYPVTIAKLGHDLTVEVLELGNDDIVYVKETCAREGCKYNTEPAIRRVGKIGDVLADGTPKFKEISRVNASCKNEGRIIYSFKYTDLNGNEYLDKRVTKKLAKDNHKVDRNPKFWEDADGTKYIGYYCEDCHQYLIEEVEEAHTAA